MITLYLKLSGTGVEAVLELPEALCRPDALDLLDAAVVRLEGGDWRAVLGAAREAGGVVTPSRALEHAPGPSTAILDLPPGATAEPQGGRGTGVRATSRDAFDRMRASGKLGRQEMVVYGFVRGHHGEDFTRQEIARGLNLGINAVTGRVHTLINEHRILRETRRRTCRVTGESVMAIGAVEGM